MKILGIDTSSKAASCALSEKGKLLGEFYINSGLTHSKTILPMIEDLFRTTGTKMDEIERIGVTVGPGSFTGLRIGLATVKGLAFGRDIPCVPVSTLEILAYNLLATKSVIVPVLDARRNQLYTGVYISDSESITEAKAPTTMLKDQLRDYLVKNYQQKRVFLLGDGTDICYNEYKEVLPSLELAPENLRYQRANSINEYVFKNWEKETCSPQELVPEYLRISQAERELMEREGR